MQYSKYYKLRKPEDKDPSDDSYDVENYDYNIAVIDEEMARIAATAHGAAIEHVVTVPASGWETLIGLSVQTINVPDVTSDTTVVMQYPVNIDLLEMDAILEAEINALSIGDGTITLASFDIVPNIDVNIAFVIFSS